MGNYIGPTRDTSGDAFAKKYREEQEARIAAIKEQDRLAALDYLAKFEQNKKATDDRALLQRSGNEQAVLPTAPEPELMPEDQGIHPPMMIPGMGAASRKVAGSPAPAPVPSPENDATSSIVSDYLRKKRMDNEQLSAARKMSNETTYGANMGQAFNQIAAGIAGASKIPETPVYANMLKDADKPVVQFAQDQKIRKDQESEDPNSARAQVYKNVLKRSYPGRFQNGDLDGLPLADAKGVSDIIGDAEKAKENSEYRKALLGARSEGAASRQTDRDEKAIKAARQEATSGEYGKMYANYQTAKRAGDAVNQFSKDPTGYKDYGTLMLALKTLQGDQSVVREAEMKQGVDATSLGNKAANAIENARSGKKLQPEQRKAIADAISVLSKAARSQYIETTKKMYDQSKRRGLPLNEIFDEPDAYEAPRSGASEPLVGLAPEKLSRLEELRKKQAQGTLGK